MTVCQKENDSHLCNDRCGRVKTEKMNMLQSSFADLGATNNWSSSSSHKATFVKLTDL